MYKTIWQTIICLGLVIPFFSFAGVVDISLSPQNPEPLERVGAILNGPLIDFDKSEIYWYINEELQSYGIGEKSFSFTAGEAEEKTILDVVVVTNEGKRFDLQKTITPTSVDLLWEAQTYTPPFYRGKALPTEGSSVKIVAMPNTKDVSVKYIYTWGVDDIFPLTDHSGYNRTSFVMNGLETGYSRKVKVSIASFDGSKNAEKQIKVSSVDPKPILYKNNLSAGLFGRQAVYGAQRMVDDRLLLRVEPYFFSNTDFQDNKLEYIWLINQQYIDENKTQDREMEFGKPKDYEKGKQQAQIRIYIKNKNVYKQQKGFDLLLNY